FVVCPETLAAGINLPARSVVLTTLLKGKPREEKLILPSAAHQMFGRAGRPQFDQKGYVFAVAHEDDVRILKWKKKFDQIDPNSKDPGILRARKELERKKPSRRKTEKYWTDGQFRMLIQAGPANLASRSMIPYRVLIFLLLKTGNLKDIRVFLGKRFNTPDRIKGFQEQLNHMVGNLQALGYLTRAENEDQVNPSPGLHSLLEFRSIDPLFGEFLVKQLARSDATEKLQALEAVLLVPPAIERLVKPPDTLLPGPLQTLVLEPTLIQLGLMSAGGLMGSDKEDEEQEDDYWAEGKNDRPMTLPDMLRLLFESSLASPEPVAVQPKWIAGGVFEVVDDFYKFVRNRDLLKNEGLILRHLLRLVIVTAEFATRSGGDPDYTIIGERVTQICQRVDKRYTEHFLAAEKEKHEVVLV
ncbi:MAG: helicase, partial [Planctomycetota bacterium]